MPASAMPFVTDSAEARPEMARAATQARLKTESFIKENLPGLMTQVSLQPDRVAGTSSIASLWISYDCEKGRAPTNRPCPRTTHSDVTLGAGHSSEFRRQCKCECSIFFTRMQPSCACAFET